MGLVTAGVSLIPTKSGELLDIGTFFQGTQGHENYFNHPSYLISLGVLAFITWLLVKIPLANAGDPNEPAPPAAMM
jgi:hypothetical protein